jgi:hypothetical protein
VIQSCQNPDSGFIIDGLLKKNLNTYSLRNTAKYPAYTGVISLEKVVHILLSIQPLMGT